MLILPLTVQPEASWPVSLSLGEVRIRDNDCSRPGGCSASVSSVPLLFMWS